MISFPERRRTLTDVAFAAFGEDAIWWGTEQRVRVRVTAREEEQRFSGVGLIDKVLMARVRSWELPQPRIQDAFYIQSGPNRGIYTIVPQPLLDAKGVWDCPVERRALP